MRTWFTTVCYEFIKFSRMRPVLIILLVMPIVLIFLLGSVFDQTIKPAKVALYNADAGELSEGIESFWKEDSLKPYIRIIQASSESDVKEMVREGTADYGVAVPSDYSAKIMSGQPAEWNAYPGRYEDRNIAVRAVLNGYMGEANLQAAAVAAFGGDQAQDQAQDQASADTAAAGNQAHEPGSLLRIGNLSGGEADVFKSVSAIQYYAAAYLIMFLLYSGMSATLSLLKQKKQGTLSRIYAIPGSFRPAVLGILSGAIALASLQSIVIVGFTTFVYGVDWGSHFGILALACLLTSIASVGLAVTLASISKSEKTMQTVYGMFVFGMTFLSGGMMAGVEEFVGNAGTYTINYWANEAIRTIMYGEQLSEVWSSIGILSIIAFALIVIGAIRLPKVVNSRV
ncbi:ABC transporter permease [Paenibacillus sp. NEAU-GSW1]|uniref:ABC transporter permease n=1 Tax=Paenibacillus sp. NEAU-GSW1 TaxID=2682486 RepID=UPI0012E25CF9|nr:ABC transporter permease [Paenibacillus sp. NEAU-GSW1]MUT66127.1 hypothetical protein [Paenibacillus sp. NEAU-GSW1]